MQLQVMHPESRHEAFSSSIWLKLGSCPRGWDKIQTLDIWPFDAFVGLFVFLIASQRAGEARMPEYWVGKFSVALLPHKFLLGQLSMQLKVI